MIWATVSSQSCFYWLHRASPSLATKNIINLILVLTIWWCLCVESAPVLLEGSVCYDRCILLAKLFWPLPYFILYSSAKLACYSRYLLTSYFWIPVPYDEKGFFFFFSPCVSSRRSCRSSYTTLPAPWETYMQVKKQQLEADMEQWTGSKLIKKYINAAYCHPASLGYMQSISCKMPTGWSTNWNQDFQEKYQ